MWNSSHVTSFLLTAYEDIGSIRYFYFCLILFMYSVIILANSLVIGLICVERCLHEPMYIFLCNLCVNELYGSTALYPSLLVNMLVDNHHISKSHCILQIFCLYTYGNTELFTLAVMAYDRYVSIYHPLKYCIIITPTKVNIFIFLIWLVSWVKAGIFINFTIMLPLCGNLINKVYCDNYSLIKLSCTDTTVLNVIGLINLFFTIGLPMLLILYSYYRILIISLTSSKAGQLKSLKTCTPHLVSLTNFCVAAIFEIVQSRFDLSYVLPGVRIVISVYFLMISPILSPIIYGIRLPKIKVVFKRAILKQIAPQ